MFRRLATALVVATAFAVPAQAQDWPTRTVSMVWPFPVGGPLDPITRHIAQTLQEKWGQPVITDTRTGATGTIAANYVARADPDGHTFLWAPDLPITMAPHLIDTPYDPVNDLELIAAWAETEQMLVVHPSIGVSNLDELIAKAKAEPGRLNFSSAGIGSPGHLCIEMIMQATGTKMTHVPYRGAAPSMTALVGGEVNVFCGPLTQGLPHVRGGRAVPIASSGAQRSALTPDVPTFIEAGLKDFVILVQYYLMAPKGAPEHVLARVSDEFKAALDDPKLRDIMASLGVYPKWLVGEEGNALIRRDLARWKSVIETAGITRQ